MSVVPPVDVSPSKRSDGDASEPYANGVPGKSSRKFPRRDYLLLPLLSLSTIFIMAGIGEIAARLIWTEEQSNSCLVQGSAEGTRYKPNCVSFTKLAEGPWVTNKYNECGYRSSASCGPKPLGAIRIAVLGSSNADGFMVPYEETFAAILERTLTDRCGRQVEVQNLGVTGLLIAGAASRIEEALALKPDVIFLVVTPNDLLRNFMNERPPSGARAGMSLIDRFVGGMEASRAVAITRHYLYRDQEFYLKIFLRSHGDDADYLRPPFTPIWEKRFQEFDSLLSEMVVKAQSQGVPLVVISSLYRQQAALLDASNGFPGTDPEAFEREISQITSKYDVPNFDVTDDFKGIAHTEDLFYVANGHMNARGQELLARSVGRQIFANHVLKACTQSSGPYSD